LTLSPRQIDDLLRRHDLAPSRALGQNFVADPNTVRRIARLARVGPGDRVVEIGPGLGSLTLALAETGAQVLAIERDRHLLPALREVLGDHAVEVVEGDATALDWAGMLGDDRWALVANLPYNVATGLVLDVLAAAPQVERMLVMVQREVAERLVADPGSRVYGIPSVKRAYWAEARIVGTVPASVFIPRPRVESALVELARRAAPAVDVAPEVLFPLVELAFNQRRKMLRRALASRLDAVAIEAAGVDPQARAEQLDVAAFGRLAAQLG